MITTTLNDLGITNFSSSEVLRGNAIEKIPEEFLKNIFPTLQILQLIRDSIKVPIIINSTFRTKEHNLYVGGKPNSLHLVFNAIDFSVPSFNEKDLVKLHSQILDRKFTKLIYFKDNPITVTPHLMGIGLYPNFIHIDTRGLLGRPSPANWLSPARTIYS